MTTSLADRLKQLVSPSEGLDLTRYLGASNQPKDVQAAVQAFLNVQDQLLDRLAQGDRSLLVTEAEARKAASTRTQKQPAASMGLTESPWGHQAVDRGRWDAVATWLDQGGMLSSPTVKALSQRLWSRALAPVRPITTDNERGGTPDDIAGAMQQRERLHRRLLATDDATYRREVLGTLNALCACWEIVDEQGVRPLPSDRPLDTDQDRALVERTARATACVAWVDALLDARPLTLGTFSPQEALDLPNKAAGPAVQKHLMRAEQRLLATAMNTPDLPSRSVTRPRL